MFSVTDQSLLGLALDLTHADAALWAAYHRVMTAIGTDVTTAYPAALMATAGAIDDWRHSMLRLKAQLLVRAAEHPAVEVMVTAAASRVVQTTALGDHVTLLVKAVGGGTVR